MDIATKTEIDAKNASKRVVQKIIEARGDLMGHNIDDKITLVAKTKSKEKGDETNKRQEIYIPPKKRQQTRDDSRLFQTLYKDEVPKNHKTARYDTKVDNVPRFIT